MQILSDQQNRLNNYHAKENLKRKVGDGLDTKQAGVGAFGDLEHVLIYYFGL